MTPRSLRVPAAPRHPNGATGISAISLAVNDLDASSRRWSALTGRQASSIGPLPGLGAVAASLDLGSTRLVLLAPESAGRGIVGGHLARGGEGLFGLSFAGPDPILSYSRASAGASI